MTLGESQACRARRAEPGTIEGVGGVVHDGKCRCRAKRAMGNGVLYRQTLNLALENTGEREKSVEQERRDPLVFPRG